MNLFNAFSFSLSFQKMFLSVAFRYSLNKHQATFIEAIKLDSDSQPWFRFDIDDMPIKNHPVVEKHIEVNGIQLKANPKGHLLNITLKDDDVFLYFNPDSHQFRFRRFPLVAEVGSAKPTYNPFTDPSEFIQEFNNSNSKSTLYERSKELLNLIPIEHRNRFKVIAMKGFQFFTEEFVRFFGAIHLKQSKSVHQQSATDERLLPFVTQKLDFYENYLKLNKSQFSIAFKLIKLSLNDEQTEFISVTFGPKGPKNKKDLLSACRDFDEAATIRQLQLVDDLQCSGHSPGENNGSGGNGGTGSNNLDKGPTTTASTTSTSSSSVTTSSLTTSSHTTHHTQSALANTSLVFSNHQQLFSSNPICSTLPSVSQVNLSPLTTAQSKDPIFNANMSYSILTGLPIVNCNASMYNKRHEPDSTMMSTVLRLHKETIASGADYRADPEGYVENLHLPQKEPKTPEPGKKRKAPLKARRKKGTPKSTVLRLARSPYETRRQGQKKRLAELEANGSYVAKKKKNSGDISSSSFEV